MTAFGLIPHEER